MPYEKETVGRIADAYVLAHDLEVSVRNIPAETENLVIAKRMMNSAIAIVEETLQWLAKSDVRPIVRHGYAKEKIDELVAMYKGLERNIGLGMTEEYYER